MRKKEEEEEEEERKQEVRGMQCLSEGNTPQPLDVCSNNSDDHVQLKLSP